MLAFLITVIIIEAIIIVALFRIAQEWLNRNVALEYQLSRLQVNANPPISKEQLKVLVKQAISRGWDIEFGNKMDQQTKQLIALANDPATSEHEARSAAIQACKRLAKIKR